LNNELVIFKKEILHLKNVISFQQQSINNTNDTNIQEELFVNRFTEKLSKLFTPTQISLILKNKNKVYKWTAEDISSAISLRSVSPKAYRYLLKREFPLPGMKRYL